MQPVEVLHEGRWLPATMMATRHDENGWEGLVGYPDPITRGGFYRWVAKASLRIPASGHPDRAVTDDGPRL